ncbi:MAG: M23 family metallopeptidase, partial [Spartobacteria bacterium]|nr:M23 family metallopeptidase [Spartobacteria bacterium]
MLHMMFTPREFPIFNRCFSPLLRGVGIVLLLLLSGCGGSDDIPVLSDDQLIEEMARHRPRMTTPWDHMSFPTAQENLLDTNHPGVFQPTASGRLESALYGSVRTANRGGQLMSSFHEGIDIAPMERDRKQRPKDVIYAVADGEVLYVNKVAGNSNYGIYIVLTHTDPLGEAYTLYSHLASVKSGIKKGVPVKSGQPIGTMGNTASTGIPMARAHLHFEVGLVLNSRFPHWYRKHSKSADHGAGHGWNLLGVDPLLFLQQQQQDPDFSMAKFMYSVPRAFTLIIRESKLPDFFKRYPLLWKDGPYQGPYLLLECAENGIPLAGRAATDEEVARAGKLPAVIDVDEDVLGRNGCHLITRRSGAWRLTRSGTKH